MKRVIIKIAKTVAVLVLLLAVTYGVLSVIGGRKYEAELQKLRAKGEPYTLVDLAGPPVPACENGAVVYQKIFNRLGSPLGSKDPRGEVYLKLTFERQKLRLADWDEARRVAAKYEWVVPMVEKAVARPECKFPVHWQDGAGVMFPHPARLRDLDRILSVKAIVYAHEGKAESAVRCIRLALQSANAVKDEPSLMSLLTRSAQLRIACYALQEVLAETELSSTQAKAVFDSLASMDLRPHCVLAAKGERGFGLIAFAQGREQGLPKMLSYFDGAAYLRLMQKQIDCAGVPYRIVKKHSSEEEQFRGVPKIYPFTRLMAAVFPRIPARVDSATADFAGGQAAMALVAYNDKFGTYPATLDEASAKLGWSIPADPFTGRSLIYKRQGKGFLVYSIGANLKDDGGRRPPKNKSEREAGDIVWSLDR